VFIYFLLGLACAALQIVAVWRGWRPLEAVARPGLMVCLYLWLYSAAGLTGAARWFGAGLLLSLAGQVLLLRRQRYVVPALAAGLLSYFAYTLGLNTPLRPVSAWGLLLALVLGMSAARLIRRILQAVRTQGLGRWSLPLAVYGGGLTLLLLAALLTLSDTAWDAGASLLIASGALALAAADTLLAWDRFIDSIRNTARLHAALQAAGQLALIAGVVVQFA
jgi:uncharacterized membrane protein YhhN